MSSKKFVAIKLARFIAFAITVLISLSACSESDEFVIHGSLAEGVKADSVSIFYDGNKLIAKSDIEDGEFTVSGFIDQPAKATISISQFNIEMILENDKYQVVWTDIGPIVDGGDINNKVYGYRKNPEYISAYKNSKKVNKEVFTDLDMMDEEAVKSARSKSNEASKKVSDIVNFHTEELLGEDQSPLVRLFSLMKNQDWNRFDIRQRISMVSELEKDLGGNQAAIEYRESLEKWIEQEKARESVSKGKTYKPVTAYDIDGKDVLLSEVVEKNKLVLLDFWASWCGPCRGEFPHLKKAYEKYKDKGFEIYAVSLDEDRDDWLVASEEEKVPWLNLLVDNGWANQYVKDYAIQGIPANFLIDSDGVIQGVGLREWKLDKVLESYFQD